MKFINKKTSDLTLFIVAFIWGFGFIGTKASIDAGIPTMFIIASRFLIATVIYGIIIFKDIIKITKREFIISFFAGIFMFFGFAFQTYGQQFTSVSNSSFLTSTNVVIVPFIVFAITGKKINRRLATLAFCSLIGSAILSLDFSSGISFNKGDLLTLISAAFFALHISYLGTKAKDIDQKPLLFVQMMTAGTVSLILHLLSGENISGHSIQQAALPLIFLGIFPSLICYYMQTAGQKYTPASKAAIILCLEGLFGSICAILFGYDTITLQIVIGGIIITLSAILTEVKPKKSA